MKARIFFLFMLVVMLASGLTFVSCDSSGGSGGGSSGPNFIGTWSNGNFHLILGGNTWTFVDVSWNEYITRGTFTFGETSVTLTATNFYSAHADAWRPLANIPPTPFQYTLNGNTLVMSGGIGELSIANGTWTRYAGGSVATKFEGLWYSRDPNNPTANFSTLEFTGNKFSQTRIVGGNVTSSFEATFAFTSTRIITFHSGRAFEDPYTLVGNSLTIRGYGFGPFTRE